MEGEVYLSEEDLARIPKFLQVDPVDFEKKFVHRTATLLRLRKPPQGQCMFHSDKRCSIHPVKPTQCRVFPYWPEIIESQETWNSAAKTCPGMNLGPLIQIETAKDASIEMRTAYPSMYP